MSSESLELAFAAVETSVSSLLDGKSGGKDSALKAIFLLNNEIGKLARVKPAKLGTLKVFQAYVNAVTVAVKGGESRMISESLGSARNYLVSASRELE